MSDFAFINPMAEQVIPTGPQLVALANEAIVNGARLGNPPNFALPSLWRLAYHAVYEAGPLIVYRSTQVG